MTKTVRLQGETGDYEIIKTRSAGRETYVRSVASGRYKWILTENITSESEKRS